MTVDIHGGIHATDTGRYTGHLQAEGDPAELLTEAMPLTDAEMRRAAVMEHIVGNDRLPWGYLARFTGGQPVEMAAVGAVMADSDLYGGRKFLIEATDDGVEITTPVWGGGKLVDPVPLTAVQDQTWRGAGAAAVQEYADALDAVMSRMHGVLSTIEATPTRADDVQRDPAKTMLVAAGQEEFDFEGEHFRMASHLSEVPDGCYSVAIRMDKPVTDEQIQQAAQLAGYAWRSTVNGESMGDPERIDMFTFRMFADSTKGHGWIGNFWQELPGTIENGSPVRKTNRSGENTKGTRLVEGLGTRRFEVYFG